MFESLNFKGHKLTEADLIRNYLFMRIPTDQQEALYQLYLHTLGNLTLTGYNGPLSNNLFADKRQQFAKSHVELNQYFKKVEHWRKEDILQWVAVLTEQALQCWPYFGDTAVAISDGDDVTGAKPESVTVLGMTHSVKNWREVLSRTLETLATAEPEKFAQVLEKYPHYIAASPQGFRSPKPLLNGYFIETNLGAASIHRFYQRAVANMGLPSDAWAVQVKPVIANAE